MYKSFFYFVPSVVWAVIIFALSTNTPVEIGPTEWLDFLSIDKVGHFTFYCIFCVLLCWGFFRTEHPLKTISATKLVIAVTVVMVYGVIMELLQLKFYEGRQLEFMDMIANAIGAIIGAIVFRKFLASRL